MITGELRNKVDRLWLEFWQGGITNPLTVIEQITFLMFMRMLDITETRNELRHNRKEKGKSFKGVFGANNQDIRWQHLRKVGGDSLLPLVRDRAFPHMKQIADKESTFGRYMEEAQLLIQKPQLLVKAVEMINELPLDKGDIKGDLYEYLLGKLTTAGVNGQFRTPRHIIRMMVDMTDPDPKWTVCDPACGTAGFLVTVMEHLLENHSSKQGVIEHENGEKTYTGDLLEPYWKHIRSDMFWGFDSTMLRIAAMNMMLHGVDNPKILYADSLSKTLHEAHPEMAENRFDLILTNPPFKGSLDFEGVHPSLTRKVKTKKTELLFLALMVRMLKPGGVCAAIVPDGVLFGSSNAHKDVRKLLIDECELQGVISMPSGVFKPYAGVSTAVLIFMKGSETKNVWYYDMEADGLSLDDKREPVEENDIPDVVERWKKRNPKKDTDRKKKAFFVPVDEIRENGYDMSINRYKEIEYEEIEYDPPKTILKRLNNLEMDIQKDLNELEVMLG